MKLGKVEKRLWMPLLRRADIQYNDHVLDFGCGTGTLTIMAKKAVPTACVHGIDIDPKILQIAQSKIKNNDYKITLKLYDGVALPYKNEQYDKVLSSLVFHHLTRAKKIQMLEEIYRVLSVGGELHIADFGQANNICMRGAFLAIQLFDGFPNTSDNIKGLLPTLMKEAGFNKVTEYKQINTLLGTISFYKASKLM